MTEFMGTDLWSKLPGLVKKGRECKAAIAYLSDDTHIKFGKNSTLIVDASDGAISSGQTSVAVLRRAFKRGAEIYSHAGLHAKVLIVNERLVVGSANISSHSHSLDEAALVTQSRPAVKSAKDWLKLLMKTSVRVDKGFLKRAGRLPVTRTGPGKGANPTLLEALETDHPVLTGFVFSWITWDADLSEDYVEKTAGKKAILAPGIDNGDWTWSEFKHSGGLLQRLRSTYRGKPGIYLATTTDDNDEIRTFTAVGGRATLFAGAWVDRSQGNRVVLVELLQRATGLRLTGRDWTSTLCKILTEGVRNSTRLRRRISNREDGTIRLSELRQIYQLGKVAVKR